MVYSIIIYVLIGVVITEMSANNDERYKEYVDYSYSNYFIEVLTWFTDLFFINKNDDDNENLGY